MLLWDSPCERNFYSKYVRTYFFLSVWIYITHHTVLPSFSCFILVLVLIYSHHLCSNALKIMTAMWGTAEMADLPRKPGGGSMMIRCEGCLYIPQGNIVALGYFKSNANVKTILNLHGHCQRIMCSRLAFTVQYL